MTNIIADCCTNMNIETALINSWIYRNIIPKGRKYKKELDKQYFNDNKLFFTYKDCSDTEGSLYCITLSSVKYPSLMAEDCAFAIKEIPKIEKSLFVIMKKTITNLESAEEHLQVLCKKQGGFAYD